MVASLIGLSLESAADIDLYNAVLDAIQLIFRSPDQAQARSYSSS